MPAQSTSSKLGRPLSRLLVVIPVKIHVNPDKCQGHNRCYVLAPELFDVDDYGYATEVNEGVVPDGLRDKAELAIANCPEHAIEIVEA